MLLLEHDAKAILAARGLPVPEGLLVPCGAAAPDLPQPGPWVVKAQVPAGGRGKAGGVRLAHTAEEVVAAAGAICGLRIAGHPVHALRLETAVTDAVEVYLGLAVDPARGRVAVMASATGGVDVETHAADSMATRHALPEPDALAGAMQEVTATLPPTLRDAAATAGLGLARAFLDLDATLLEVNPLFVRKDGGWVLGDVRLALDENALPRQPVLADLLDRRPEAYPDAVFKRAQGYDLVVVDPDGEVGLVSTGAGLSMKLIDEMTNQGLRPYNFCDIRSGMMRGDPARLVEALARMQAGPRLRCVLVSIFAGITDLGEFARLLIAAVKATPDLDLPLVVRLVGNNQAEAERLLRASGLPLEIEPDLDRAVALCAGYAGGGHG